MDKQSLLYIISYRFSFGGKGSCCGLPLSSFEKEKRIGSFSDNFFSRFLDRRREDSHHRSSRGTCVAEWHWLEDVTNSTSNDVNVNNAYCDDGDGAINDGERL